MLKLKVENVSIRGISTVIPKNELCLLDDKTLYDGNEKQLKKIIKSTGFNKRRVSDESTTSLDLCLEAAKNLINDMKIDSKTIDGVIFVTQTPDYFLPAGACIAQNKLNISNSSFAFDINQGCSGYCYGLFVASNLINGGAKRILLLAGDTVSKFKDMFSVNKSAPIFGDAGSATLIEADKDAKPMYFDIGTNGKEWDAIVSRNGAFRNIAKEGDFYEDGSYKYHASMDGTRVMEFTLDRVPTSIKDVLEFSNTKKDEIDYFILHQANKFILENIAMISDIELEKMPFDTLSKYGNQSSASIPCAICDNIKYEIQTKPLKLLLSGFGVGLSWVSLVINTDKIYCSGIREL